MFLLTASEACPTGSSPAMPPLVRTAESRPTRHAGLLLVGRRRRAEIGGGQRPRRDRRGARVLIPGDGTNVPAGAPARRPHRKPPAVHVSERPRPSRPGGAPP